MKALIRLCGRTAIGRDKRVSEVEQLSSVDVTELMLEGEGAELNNFTVLGLC